MQLYQESDQSQNTKEEGRHSLEQQYTDRKQTENYLLRPAEGTQKELEDLRAQVK